MLLILLHLRIPLLLLLLLCMLLLLAAETLHACTHASGMRGSARPAARRSVSAVSAMSKGAGGADSGRCCPCLSEGVSYLGSGPGYSLAAMASRASKPNMLGCWNEEGYGAAPDPFCCSCCPIIYAWVIVVLATAWIPTILLLPKALAILHVTVHAAPTERLSGPCSLRHLRCLLGHLSACALLLLLLLL